MHRYILYNDEVREATDRVLNPGQVGLLNGWGVFTTIRVAEGVLFAWERHYARMQRDAAILHVPMPKNAEELKAQLQRLVDANQAPDSTLRVALVRNKGGLFEAPGMEREYDLIAFTKDLAQWGESVALDLMPQARHADSPFAGTKMLSWSFNLTMLEMAQGKGFDEVVLLNERGEVSELTSANIFVVRGSEVVTPPLSSGCLPGVTRALLLEEIRVPGVTIREANLMPGDLETADAVFITSSTRDTMPVRSVAGLRLRPMPPGGGAVRLALQAAFDELILRYVAAHRRPQAVR